MSQSDYTQVQAIWDTYLAQLNTHLAAIVTQNSGGAPGDTFAAMLWADDTAGPPWEYNVRSHDDASWATIFDTDGNVIAAAGTFSGDVGIHTASPELFLHIGPDAPTGTYLDSANNNGLLVAPNVLRGIVAIEGNSEAWLTLTAQDGTANQRKFGIEIDGTTAFFRSLNDALGLRQIFIQAEMATSSSDLLLQPGGGDVILPAGDLEVSTGDITVTLGDVLIPAGSLGVGVNPPLTDVHIDMKAPATLTTLAGSIFLQAFANVGIDNFGSGIIFGDAAGSPLGGSGSSILGYQPTAAVATAGLRFYTHGSTGGAPRVEAMRLDSTQAAIFSGFLVLPKASESGIKVDRTTPTFGFADIIGDQFSNNTGATKPILTTYNGAVKSWKFGVGDEAYMSFHMPHDYKKGTDIFLHIHWSHTGTLVTGGTVTFKATSIYSKGHNQAPFTSSPAVGTFVGTASTTQYQHIITEVQYSDPTPTGLEIDTDLLEPDGVIEMTFEVDANGITVSSGGDPDLFIHLVDIHYQTTGLIGTKDKVPDFYV